MFTFALPVLKRQEALFLSLSMQREKAVELMVGRITDDLAPLKI
ncbi:hypothetical protein DB29_01521 [Shouchella clausii]|nr:hypothetical protein DB29_01521 [Shouchella clausii]